MSCDPLTGFVCFFGKNFKTFARKVGKTKKEKKKKAEFATFRLFGPTKSF